MSERENFRIVLRESGGFTGLAREARIDAGGLDPAKREALEGLISASGFFAAEIREERPFPDALSYELTIAGPEGKRTLQFHSGSCPEAFQPLLDFLSPFLSYKK